MESLVEEFSAMASISDTVSKSLEQRVSERKKKIFVGGLPDGITDQELESYFGQFGTITDHVIIHHKETRKPRGFGFVTFDSDEAVNAVLQTSFHTLKGKKVEVMKAKPRDASSSSSSTSTQPMPLMPITYYDYQYYYADDAQTFFYNPQLYYYPTTWPHYYHHYHNNNYGQLSNNYYEYTQYQYDPRFGPMPIQGQTVYPQTNPLPWSTAYNVPHDSQAYH